MVKLIKVKNQNFLLLSCMLLLGLLGCKNDANNNGEANETDSNGVWKTDAPPIKGPESIAGIEELVKKIDAEMDSMSMAGPNYVFEGPEKTKVEVMVYSKNGLPHLVYTKTPKLESWYYLLERRPVYLKELELTENGFVQNRFYYGTQKLIGAERRKGASPDEANSASPGKYRGSKDDFRLSGEAVTGKVLEFLYGKMK